MEILGKAIKKFLNYRDATEKDQIHELLDTSAGVETMITTPSHFLLEVLYTNHISFVGFVICN